MVLEVMDRPSPGLGDRIATHQVGNPSWCTVLVNLSLCLCCINR